MCCVSLDLGRDREIKSGSKPGMKWNVPEPLGYVSPGVRVRR